ncbi:thiamine phosphate synthase [Actinoplanes sp. N902-109]|uniref:thiamine phosphate synthase n=1 Tax=Actinoplanes sp. (strain N902-109) TaxID=649831 RepID=UPI0003295E81|nr:thiamine phosphate synthase [Actinoplanes sp. N902-109]AGL14472.1 thiamine-phosphate pyrophosphorylase [Actinoplanes sp. N902-109]
MGPVFPRLHVITDSVAIATAVVAAGPPDRLAIQVRVTDGVTDRVAYDLAAEILAVCRAAGVMCLVNDLLHVALAVGADGGHVGADDLPVAAARKILPTGVVGATCRDPEAARQAVAAGASYLGVGPAYPTTTKTGLPAPLGPDRIGAVAQAVPGTPVLAIGGVTVDRVAELRRAGVAGVAVVGSVTRAADPGAATARLIEALA